jgi:hypothetical protein
VGRTTSLAGHTFQASQGASTYRPTATAADGVHAFYSNVGGTAVLQSVVAADGQYAQVSDARLKTEISPARGYLSDLMQIEVVTYKWKDSDQPNKLLGVIAQQVEQVFPSVVKEVESNPQTGIKNKMLSLDTFIPMLITAVQELKTEQDALHKRLQQLEADK